MRREYRRTLRARDREQVREAVDREAEVALRAVRPEVRERAAAAPLDAEPLQWLSRGALATGTAFSKTRANAAVAGMLEQGVLESTGDRIATGGRRSAMLRLSRDLGVLLGVAMGATGLEVGVLTPDLQLLAHHSEPVDFELGQFVNPPLMPEWNAYAIRGRYRCRSGRLQATLPSAQLTEEAAWSCSASPARR